MHCQAETHIAAILDATGTNHLCSKFYWMALHWAVPFSGGNNGVCVKDKKKGQTEEEKLSGKTVYPSTSFLTPRAWLDGYLWTIDTDPSVGARP